MKKTIFKTAVVLLTAIMTISCSKDGATGATGPAGANGTNGTNGNANVIGTADFTEVPTDWITDPSNTKYVNLTLNSITQNIVDKGIVMVYKKSGSNYYALPRSLNGIEYNFNFGLNFIQILLSYSDSSSFTINSNIIFRVVVISPSNKATNPNTNWNDYEQVKEALHLKD